MRAFIALELPQNTKNALAQLQSRLKKSGADVKWVAPENIHVTLKFLGDIEEATVKNLSSSLDLIAQKSKSFRINLDCLGAFPSVYSPRVIWVGVNEGKENVCVLAGLIEEAAGRIGLQREQRPFSPHATIGRVKTGLNRLALAKLMEEINPQFKNQAQGFPVSKITIFKSTLRPCGAIYEVIKEAAMIPE